MRDHPLDGLRVEDEQYTTRRTVSFDRADSVLTVRLYHEHETEERHFRLTEVQQVWTEVES